MKQRKYRRKGN